MPGPTPTDCVEKAMRSTDIRSNREKGQRRRAGTVEIFAGAFLEHFIDTREPVCVKCRFENEHKIGNGEFLGSFGEPQERRRR